MPRRRIAMQFLVFALVGGVSTMGHFMVLWMLHAKFAFGVLLATTCGYAAGALINYLLNRRITFARSEVGLEAIPRFLVVVLAGLTLNFALMFWIGLVAPGLNYLLRQCIATAITLIFNFVLNRSWTFPHPQSNEA